MNPLILNQQGIHSEAIPYLPGMMTYDGSTGYYRKTHTSSGNLVTAVARFNHTPFTGGGVQNLMRLTGSSNTQRCVILIVSSDHAITDIRNKVLVTSENASGTDLCRLVSLSEEVDGTDKVVFYSMDATNGTVTFYVDGVDADDTGNSLYVAPTTGTLESGTGDLYVGAASPVADLYGGGLGYFGYRDAYLTNPTDFYHPTNGLQELDESTWTEWGSQPLFWNQYGTMNENKGSAGDMTINGDIGFGTGVPYFPGMMMFDGGYYVSPSKIGEGGQPSLIVARFNISALTSTNAYIVRSGTSKHRMVMGVYPTDHATVDRRGKLFIYAEDGSGTTLCRLISESSVVDGEDYCAFGFYDDAGVGMLYVDGLDVDDTGNANRVLTTGQIQFGASSFDISVGASASGTSNFPGDIGYVGYHTSATYETTTPTPADFYHSTNGLQEINETTWAAWGGSQPLYWNQHGTASDNKGANTNLTKTGTITGPS